MPSHHDQLIDKVLTNLKLDGSYDATRLDKEELILLCNMGMNLSYDADTEKITLFWPNFNGLYEVGGQLLLNHEVFAAIVNAGGDPSQNSYPLKTATFAVQILAGGIVPSTTVIAAVPGAKIFLEEWHVSVLTDTGPDAGAQVQARDGAGGAVLDALIVNEASPDKSFRPLVFGTAATLLEIDGDNVTMGVLDVDDWVKGTLKYREI